MMCLVIMGSIMSTAVYGYISGKPTLEGLCRDADIIIIAEPEKAQRIDLTRKTERGSPPEPTYSTFTLAHTKYKAIAFRVKQVLKGKLSGQKFKEGLSDEMRLKFPIFIVLLIETEVAPSADFWVPKYKEGTDYVLFLGPEVLDELHTKSDGDRILPAHPASPEMITKIERIVAEQNEVYLLKGKGDNVGYTIPKDSEEKSVTLTRSDREQGYSIKTEYWLSGNMVGERRWRGRDTLAYENPLKNGRRHGEFRAW